MQNRKNIKLNYFFLQKLRTNKATSKLIAKDNFKFD